MHTYESRLLEHHQEMIESSGISKAVADERFYSSVTDATQLERLGYAPTQRLVPGLLIPIRTVSGEVESWSYRPDAPRTNENGTIIKYEVPWGKGFRLDVPPATFMHLRDVFVDLIVTEGSKKVDALVTHGYIPIGLNGVTCWGKKDSTGRTLHDDWRHFILKGRRIYICFDSDLVDKSGVRHEMRELSRALTRAGALVKVLRIPSVDGEKVGIDDWLASGHSIEDLTPIDVWTSVLPAKRESQLKAPGIPFPLVYPSIINSVLEKVVADSGAADSIVGPSMLPVIGSLIGADTCVEVGGSWVERPSLWVAIIADSGDNKSPGFRPLMKPLRDLEERYAGFNQQKRRDYEAQKAQAARGVRIPIPTFQQKLLDDATIEAIYKILEDNPDGLMLFNDEIKGWITGMDKYFGGEKGERQKWLKIANCEPLLINRVGQGSLPLMLNIKRPFVCILGGIQPQLVSTISKSEDGLAPRFLFAITEPKKRDEFQAPPRPGSKASQYDDWNIICQRVLSLDSVTLGMEEDVYDTIWLPWYQENKQKGLDSPLMRTAYKKMEGFIWRFAIILHVLDHVCEGTQIGSIDVDQFNRAAKLAEWFEAHTIEVIKLDDGATARDYEYSDQLDKLLQWIIAHPNCKKRDIQQRGPAFARNGKRLTEMLADLDIQL